MCKHKHTTIIYYEGIIDIDEPVDVFFTAHQCDDCGMLLAAANSDTVAAAPYEPPALDKVAYWNALLKQARAVVESAKNE